MSQFKEDIIKQIEALAQGAADASGVFILHFVLRGTPSRPLIEITLDAERPIVIADCEAVSKSLLASLEASSIKEANYRLNVLSPGVDEPLIHDYQFQRSIGKTIKVRFLSDDNTLKEIQGVLKAIDGDMLNVVISPKSSKSKKSVDSGELISIIRSSVESAVQVATFS